MESALIPVDKLHHSHLSNSELPFSDLPFVSISAFSEIYPSTNTSYILMLNQGIEGYVEDLTWQCLT